jgi:Na+/H+ antiporter NhaD/arsenite permease-like protein
MIENLWYMALIKTTYYMSIALFIITSLAFIGKIVTTTKEDSESEEERKKNRDFFYRWIAFTSISLLLYFWSSPQMI